MVQGQRHGRRRPNHHRAQFQSCRAGQCRQLLRRGQQFRRFRYQFRRPTDRHWTARRAAAIADRRAGLCRHDAQPARGRNRPLAHFLPMDQGRRAGRRRQRQQLRAQHRRHRLPQLRVQYYQRLLSQRLERIQHHHGRGPDPPHRLLPGGGAERSPGGLLPPG